MSGPSEYRRALTVLVVVGLAATGLVGAWVSGMPASSPPLAHAPTAGAAPAASLPHAVPSATSLAGARAATVGSGGTGPAARGLPASDIFYPNPARQGVNAVRGTIAPSFNSAPAPMGVSDLGVGSSGPYTYYTAGFEGSLTLASFTAFQPGYVAPAPFEAPDWGLFQLNAVAVNISYAPTAPLGVFWIQNAVHVNGSTIQFEDNIWNFSAPTASISPAVLYGSGLTYRNQFYAAFSAPRSVTYPFTVNLSINVTHVATHDVVRFNYTIVPSSGPKVSGTYDTVTFNGTYSASTAPRFEVDGSAATPSGELYDAELVLGGNGGGTNTNVVALNGSATLRAWNHTALAYRPVHAAYDFGADSSETALGVGVHYVGAGGTAYLSSGPSLLYGLWNTTTGPIAVAAAPGFVQVRLTTVPAYAFLFANVSLGGSSYYSYAPSSAGGVVAAELPPALNGTPYEFDAWADGFAPASVTVTNNSSGTQTITLVSSPTTENAPIYLNGNAQATAFAAAGLPAVVEKAGTLYLNASKVKLAAPFLVLNDLANPTFQLFVAQGLSTNVAIDALLQDPSSFNYTFYNSPTRFYPGWTQGYFFFGGRGAFTVTHVSLNGEVSLLAQPTPTFPAPTIEFYLTSSSVARSIAASNGTAGVTAYGGAGLSVSSETVQTEAQGLVAAYATGLTASGVSATGLATVGVQLDHATNARVLGLSASGFATGVVAGNSTNVTVLGMSVSLQATAFDVNATSSSNVSWVNLTGGVASSLGSWTHSVRISFQNVSATGSGLVLQNDSLVDVQNGTASGYANGLVQDFSNSTHGRFGTIFASGGAVGLNLSNADNLTLRNVLAEIGSTGAVLYNSTNVTGTYVTASVNSTGISWQGGRHGWFTDVNASTLSAGLWIANVTGVKATGVVATNLTVGPSLYFVNPLTFLYYPVAGVAFYNDSFVNVSDVVATGYAFAVWSNGTKALSVVGVQGWYDGTLVDINATFPYGTTYSKVQQVFAFGCAYGVYVLNSTHITVSLSTFEASTILGLEFVNSTHDAVQVSNFVANNGSSVTHSYSPNHVQAWTNNSSAITFSGNFWADWSGAGAYVVNNSIRDTSPQGPFQGTYVEFTESGLSGGQAWQVGLGALPAIFNTTASLFYVPGWVLPNATILPFLVLGPLSPTPHPIAGNVSWYGLTLPAFHIQFGEPPAPFTIFGLLAWEFAAIVVVAVLVLLTVLVILWRRRPRTPRPQYQPDFPE